MYDSEVMCRKKVDTPWSYGLYGTLFLRQSLEIEDSWSKVSEIGGSWS